MIEADKFEDEFMDKELSTRTLDNVLYSNHSVIEFSYVSHRIEMLEVPSCISNLLLIVF